MPDFTITLTINGAAHDLTLDTRTTLLDLLRERLGLTGAKKGCDHGQCGACTVLLDGRRVKSCLALAVAHDGAEVDHDRGARRRRRLHPMQHGVHRPRRVPVRLLHPGPDLLRRRRCSTRPREGWPSFVTADLAAGEPTLDDARDPRAHERQPVPLRRLREHRRRRSEPTAAPMRPFTLRAGGGRRGRGRASLDDAGPARALPRRRDEPRRPHEARRRVARRARRRHAPPARPDRGADGGGLRIGAAVRNSDLAADPARPRRYPVLAAGACSPAPPASCGTWRRSAATCCSAHAAPYFADVTKACNKREPGTGCPARAGHHRNHAILGHSEALRRDAPVGHGGRARRARRDRPRRGPRRPARDPHAGAAPPPRRRAAARHRAAPGRARSPPSSCRRWRSPGAPRYRKVRERASFAFALVSVAAALDVARRRRARTAGSRSAPSRTCRGGRCGPRRRSVAGRPRRRRSARRPTRSSPRPTHCRRTRSRSPSHDGSSSGRSRS